MSVQKTEFQITGHLYKRSNSDKSWANRYVSLSTDTGTIKIYAEKSGKKTMRGNCNIKKGKFTALSAEDVGKSFAFEVTSDDTKDDAIMVFAASDEQAYNEWKSSIELCFTIGETRRRKSVLSTSYSASSDLGTKSEPELIPDAVISPNEHGSTIDQDVKDAVRLGIAEQMMTSPIEDVTSAPSDPVAVSIETAVPVAPSKNNEVQKVDDIPTQINELNLSITVNIPPDHDAEVQMLGHSTPGLEEKQRPKSGTPLGRMRLISLKEEGSASPSSRRSTPSADLTEDQRHKLDKLTNRKSFKVPQSMKNLLNSNGLDKEREEILKQVKLELQSPTDSPMTVPHQAPIPAPQPSEPKPPREIKLASRPTDPQRTGHIFRFDEKSKEHGEDAWITQLAVLDVPTGHFELFSEVMGRKISRLKLNTSEFEAVPFDCVFYGKLFAFELRKIGSDSSSEPITILAADDMEGYGYWIVSFQDAQGKDSLVGVEGGHVADKHDEKPVHNVPVPVTEPIVVHAEVSKKLTAKQKLEMQMKAKMEGRPIPTFDDEEDSTSGSPAVPVPAATPAPAPDPAPVSKQGPLTAKQKLEMQMKAKMEGKPIPTFDDEESIATPLSTAVSDPLPSTHAFPTVEASKKLTAKQKLELQMKAKMEGRPIPTFDDDETPPPSIAPKLPLTSMSDSNLLNKSPTSALNSVSILSSLTTKQKLEMQMKAKMEGRPIPTFDEEDSTPAAAYDPPAPLPLTAKQKLEMQMKAKMEGKPIPSFDDEADVAIISKSSLSVDNKSDLTTSSLPPLPRHDPNGAKALLESQMKAKLEGRPIPQIIEGDMSSPVSEEKSNFAIPVPVRGTSIQSFSSINTPTTTTPVKAPITSPKSSHFRSHEDPSQTLQHSNFGMQRSPQSAAGDLEISKTMSRTQSLGSISAVVAVNDDNMDDVLRLGRGPGSSGSNIGGHGGINEPHLSAPRGSQDQQNLSNLAILLRKVSYPSDRLSRRIKIWYCSSGFALSSVQEVEQFVQELKQTGDTVLQQFAEEKFDKINDWANLLEVLRKYEQKMLVDMPNRQPIIESVNFEVDVTSEGKSFTYRIDEEFNIENLIRQVAKQFKVSEFLAAQHVPAAVLRSDCNPWTHGMISIKEDLAFAEDLVLYQEEVIEHMWQSHSALKGVIDQKDEVINQLYNQVSELQDRIRQYESEANFGSKAVGSVSMFTSNGIIASASKPNSKVLQAMADREFNAADQDGDGRISREEWRRWIQDKHNLTQEHNQVKQALMNEIKTLRAAMPAKQEQLVADLLKNEEIRKKLEEDMIQAHIEKDSMKDELLSLDRKCRDLEHEKQMAEEMSHERIKDLERENEKLREQISELMVASQTPPLQPHQSFQQPPQQTHQQPQPGLRSSFTGGVPSNNPRLMTHPYAYDMPDDRPIELPDDSLAVFNATASSMLGSSTPHTNEFDLGGGAEHGIDLMTLAGMDDAKLMMPSYYSDSNIGSLGPEQDGFQVNEVDASGRMNALETYSSAQRLGSNSDLIDSYGYQGHTTAPNRPTPTSRILVQSSGPLGSVPSNAIAVNAPRTLTIGSNPQRSTLIQQGANVQTNSALDFNRSSGVPSGGRSLSPRASNHSAAIPPSVPQIQIDKNHPLRNALREDIRSKNQYSNNLFNVPSPYGTLKPKSSVMMKNSMGKTTALETSQLPNTLQRRSESPRENNAANMNGAAIVMTPGKNRTSSPSRTNLRNTVSSASKSKEKGVAGGPIDIRSGFLRR